MGILLFSHRHCGDRGGDDGGDDHHHVYAYEVSRLPQAPTFSHDHDHDRVHDRGCVHDRDDRGRDRDHVHGSYSVFKLPHDPEQTRKGTLVRLRQQ